MSDYATLSDMERLASASALRRMEVYIERLGRVRLREVTAGECLRAMQACREMRADGSWELDMPRYQRARAALALEEPSLGATFEEKLARTETVLAQWPAEVLAELLAHVEAVCSGELFLGRAIEEAVQRLNDLELCFYVLARKQGWFKDLEAVGLGEVRDWARYYRAQDKAAEDAIEQIGCES